MLPFPGSQLPISSLFWAKNKKPATVLVAGFPVSTRCWVVGRTRFELVTNGLKGHNSLLKSTTYKTATFSATQTPCFGPFPNPSGTSLLYHPNRPARLGKGSRFDTIAPPATLAPVERHGIGVPVARRTGRSRAIEVAAFSFAHHSTFTAGCVGHPRGCAGTYCRSVNPARSATLV